MLCSPNVTPPEEHPCMPCVSCVSCLCPSLHRIIERPFSLLFFPSFPFFLCLNFIPSLFFLFRLYFPSTFALLFFPPHFFFLLTSFTAPPFFAFSFLLPLLFTGSHTFHLRLLSRPTTTNNVHPLSSTTATAPVKQLQQPQQTLPLPHFSFFPFIAVVLFLLPILLSTNQEYQHTNFLHHQRQQQHLN